MPAISLADVDLLPVWTWFLLLIRGLGLFISVPGIGGERVPPLVRASVAMVIAFSVTMAGVRADTPEDLFQGGLMITTELLLGVIIGLIPAIIIGGIGVAGQVSSGTIGLGQANMIDPSLGANISVLSVVQTLVGTIIFLFVDGHHALIRAVAGGNGGIGVGNFRPDMDTAIIIGQRFSESFELAIAVAAPILVTILITQFVLGLVTKFIPQINIFIISLPLTIGVGLFIIAFSWNGFARHVHTELTTMEETLGSLMQE